MAPTRVPDTIPVVHYLEHGTDAQKHGQVGWHTKFSGTVARCTGESSCSIPAHEANILLNVRFFSDNGKDGNLEVMLDRIDGNGVVLRNTFSFHHEPDQVRIQAIPYGKPVKIANTDLEATFRKGDSWQTFVSLGPVDTAGP
jgi:hypothetical protein